ncbi:hypothetical protein JY97_04070 [Alkalispirochaeta odontotermitis]|nr:hypothetical protein JY97_04070 [Alkalispirochaeta odontotermitis]CAB1074200.1 hypothetical protein D1AOALGA4SA_2075 [Olavius algarvensis Delta 1 endosymbiont]
MNTSRQQSVLSMIILSGLIIIATGILITQKRPNPAILQNDELLPTADPSGQSGPPTVIEAFAPLPSNLKPMTSPEQFNADNLSDKINGKAELYLSAGFSRLVSQRYQDEAVSGLWIEVFVYDMGSGQNAFAVFSAQRRENAESLDFTQYAYSSPNAVFLTHGRFYLELIASQVSREGSQSMQQLAAAFIGNTQIATVTIAEREIFPEQDLAPDSIALIAADAFGHELMDQVYTAEYRMNEGFLMAYLSRRQTPGEAQKLADAYGNFLLEFGGRNITPPMPIKNAQTIEILDTYEIIFSFGPYLAGVREATNPDDAAMLAEKLFNQIRQAAGDYQPGEAGNEN